MWSYLGVFNHHKSEFKLLTPPGKHLHPKKPFFYQACATQNKISLDGQRSQSTQRIIAGSKGWSYISSTKNFYNEAEHFYSQLVCLTIIAISQNLRVNRLAQLLGWHLSFDRFEIGNAFLQLETSTLEVFLHSCICINQLIGVTSCIKLIINIEFVGYCTSSFSISSGFRIAFLYVFQNKWTALITRYYGVVSVRYKFSVLV